jgi:hypothetical protein
MTAHIYTALSRHWQANSQLLFATIKIQRRFRAHVVQHGIAIQSTTPRAARTHRNPKPPPLCALRAIHAPTRPHARRIRAGATRRCPAHGACRMRCVGAIARARLSRRVAVAAQPLPQVAGSTPRIAVEPQASFSDVRADTPRPPVLTSTRTCPRARKSRSLSHGTKERSPPCTMPDAARAARRRQPCSVARTRTQRVRANQTGPAGLVAAVCLFVCWFAGGRAQRARSRRAEHAASAQGAQ